MPREFFSFPQLALIIGLLSVMGELFIGIETGFDLVVIGGILIISGFVGILTGQTLVVFVLAPLLTLLYFLFVRRAIKAKLKSFHTKTNVDKLVGDKGLVTQDINPHHAGVVKIDGEEWRATATTAIKAGTQIKVDSVSGVTVSVKPL